MNYDNSTEAYIRSVSKVGMRQYTHSQEQVDLAGWLNLWKPAGKILLMIFPLVLGIHMIVANAVTNTNKSIVAVDNQRHDLMDKHIELLAQKAALFSPDSIREMAGNKLSLFADSGKQVGKFNRKTGTFIYP